MKPALVLILLTYLFPIKAQSIIEWSPENQLTLTDFYSSQTEISNELSSYSISPATAMVIDPEMMGHQFGGSKNFNSTVTAIFSRNAASITAHDSTQAERLLKMGQYQFDLTELYARKFRKRLYEERVIGSDVNQIQPLFDEFQEELTIESDRVTTLTDSGQNIEILALEHGKVLLAIKSLSDFCKECKPHKSKKQNHSR